MGISIIALIVTAILVSIFAVLSLHTKGNGGKILIMFDDENKTKKETPIEDKLSFAKAALQKYEYELELKILNDEYKEAVQPYIEQIDKLNKRKDTVLALIVSQKEDEESNSGRINYFMTDLQSTLIRIQGIEMAMTPLILNYNIKKKSW